MSRRKQAQPRSLKFEDMDQEDVVGEYDHSASPCDDEDEDIKSEHSYDSLESDALGSTPGSSWSSAAEGATPSPTSTPGPDAPEPPFTLGATDHTPYQCHFCDKAFPRLSYLKKHEQTHSDQMPFRCEWCSRLFKHKRSRDRHVKLHTGDRKYRCAHCDSAFSRSDHLKIHMKTHDNQKPFQCTACNRGYNTAAALTSHMQGHKRGRAARRAPRAAAAVPAPAPSTLACGYCTRDGFVGVEQLRAHVQTAHVQSAHEQIAHAQTTHGNEHASPAPPEQLTPTDLSKKSSRDDSDAPSRSADDTSSPISTTTQTRTLLCNQCNAALPDFESFRAHVKAHLEAGDGDVCASDACPHCGATFTSAVMCARHVCAHFAAATTEFACRPCERTFAAPDELQRHLLEIHTQHIYRCALCNEIFDSKVAIQVHFAVQHSSESIMYRCTACGGSSTFRSEAEFARHVRALHWPPATISTVRRCPLCRVACATDTELRMHVAAHARAHHAAAVHATHAAQAAHATHATHAAHAYRCPICRDAFAVEFLLDRHMQTHHAAVASQLINGNNCRQKGVRLENNNGIAEDETACEPCATGDEPRARARHKNGAVSLRCAYCGEQSRSRADLEAHTKTHSAGAAPGRHKCLICDEVLPTAAILAEHKLTHCKVVAGDVCARCHQTLASEEHFMAHLTHHAPALPAPCVVCRQTLASDVEARMHARFHLKGTSASTALEERTCALCLQIFVPARTEGRNTSEAGAGDPARVCAVCYRRHAGTALAPATPPEVPQLSAQTPTRVKLEANVSDECRLCRRSLGSPTRLQTHLIEHTFAGCGAFTCYLCSAVFTGAAGLQRHLPEHSVAARPYDCSRCGLKFFFRAELDNHAFVHVDEAEAEVRRRSLYGAGLGEYSYPQNDFEGTLELLAARARLEAAAAEEERHPTKRQRLSPPLLPHAVKVKRESDEEEGAGGGAEEYIEVSSPPVVVKSEADAELQLPL